jgi:type I restriction enzyme S subunit
MIDGLGPYPKMRDSGLPYLGAVPEHWKVSPVGRLGRLFKGNGGSKEDELASGVPCVRYGDLYTRHEFFIQGTKGFVSANRANAYTGIEYGDLLFAASGETMEDIGRSSVNLLREPACCGGDILVLRPEVPMDARFLGYAADAPPSRHQKATMGRGFTVVHVYASQIKQLGLPVPPLSEQAAIVRFLDHADRLIRRYIRTKQKLVTLLDEQKRSIINEAVTGRIDIRSGQRHPSYRHSAAPWLGELPSHWNVIRSKRLFTPRTELARPNDVQLSATQAYGVIPQEDYERRVGRKIVKIFLHLDKRRHVEVDDFVISMRSFQGGLERAWASGCIRSSYVVLRPITQVDVRYFAFLFKSPSYIRALQSTANFIRDGQDLNFANFCAVDLPFPPIGEQRQIADALDTALADTAAAMDRANREISLLREYRTRLIADVVTGKLDVREAAARLPTDEDDQDLMEETAESLDEDDSLEDPNLDEADLEAEA